MPGISPRRSVMYGARGEVRPATGGTVLFYARFDAADPVIQPLVADDSDRNWIQIARAGEYKGHHQGEFTFDAPAFQSMVRNFKRQGQPLPVTYGHLSPTEKDLVGAAGWIHDLRIKDGERPELWAYVEWTERAAGMIERGEHRFVSVEVRFDAKDPETAEDQGPTLMALGLVLSPFIRGMTPASTG